MLYFFYSLLRKLYYGVIIMEEKDIFARTIGKEEELEDFNGDRGVIGIKLSPSGDAYVFISSTQEFGSPMAFRALSKVARAFGFEIF